MSSRHNRSEPLEGKIASVTGGSRGTGADVASKFGRLDVLVDNA